MAAFASRLVRHLLYNPTDPMYCPWDAWPQSWHQDGLSTWQGVRIRAVRVSQLCIFPLGGGLTEGSMVWKITPQIKHSPRATKTISNSVLCMTSSGYI